MDLHLQPKDHARLVALAHKTGRDESEIVKEVIAAYLDGLDEVREMLDSRADDIESGRVKPVSSEQFWENLDRRKKAFLLRRS
jgi:predicted DNA-binding protein